MRPVSILRLSVVLALALAALPAVARAQDRVLLNAETKAKTGLYPIALAPPVDSDPQLGKLAADTLAFDLKVRSMFRTMQSWLGSGMLQGRRFVMCGCTTDSRRW